MTAEARYSPAAQAVINDYIDRLKCRLAGFPSCDREDLLREIASHIDEGFAVESGSDEMQRLLQVLRRLGEPADVINERMSPAMVKLGKKKGLPFYILSGVLIALFGLPLGLGAACLVISVLATIFALIVAYFMTAISLLVSGVAGIIVGVLLIADPTIIERIDRALGANIAVTGFPPYLSPQTDAFITVIICAILAGIGALMLWGGRYLLGGIGYLFKISWEKIQETTARHRQSSVAEQSSWIASVSR